MQAYFRYIFAYERGRHSSDQDAFCHSFLSYILLVRAKGKKEAAAAAAD